MSWVSERVAKLLPTNSIYKRKNLNLSHLSNQMQKVRGSTVVEQLWCSLSLFFYNDTKKRDKIYKRITKKVYCQTWKIMPPSLPINPSRCFFFLLKHSDIKRCNKNNFVRKDRWFLYLACSCTEIHVKLKETWNISIF